MTVYEIIISTYPDLRNEDFNFVQGGKIMLADDGDGIQYIAKWEYSKPIPEGLVLGKP